MRLQSLLTLVDGMLLNSPSITSYKNIAFSASKVKRGDLYVSLNGNFFDEAVANGAYIILFDSDLTILDEEIAWVKVKSLHKALIKLIRFELSEKKIKAFRIDSKTYSILQSISTDSKIFHLKSSIEENAQKLYNLHNNAIVLCTDDTLLAKLFAQVHSLPKNQTPIQIISSEIFHISFIYKDIYYEKVALSSFFINSLQSLVALLEENNITFSLKQLRSTLHFQVQFIDKFLNAKDFGKSDKAIIFESDEKIVQEILSYLKKYATWCKVIAIYNQDYTKISEIYNILSNENFCYAIIANQNKFMLEDASFQQRPTQASLI